MGSDDILVVKTNIVMTKDNYNTLYKSLLGMKELGVILLPSYCDAILAPGDCEIEMDKGEHHVSL